MAGIKEDIISTKEIKKSRFITYLHKTDDEEEAKEFLRFVRKQHPDANHHCSAMIIGSIRRSSDDKEPSGTAGVPMLEVLSHKNMDHIMAVVVRYFGGIKLGTGGLVRAYSSSVQEALEKAVLTELCPMQEYAITFDYALIGRIDAYFHNRNIEVTDKEFNENVRYTYLVESDIADDLQALSNGMIHPEHIRTSIREKVIGL